jgi:hypothetical protein
MTGETSTDNFPERCSQYDSSSFAQDLRRQANVDSVEGIVPAKVGLTSCKSTKENCARRLPKRCIG